MQYGAFVTRIKVSPHPNADRLALGRVGGFQVVVGRDTPDGQLGLFFSRDLIISPEYADANDLLPRYNDAGEKIGGGFFPRSRRVKSQKFRGETSDGYFAPLESLGFTGADIGALREGDLLVEANGVPICSRWLPPPSRAGGASRVNARPSSRWFPEVGDTGQFGYNLNKIEPDDIVWVTLKMHGTSGRTGMCPVLRDVPQSWWQKLLRRPVRWRRGYDILTGSRRVVLAMDPGASDVGHHGSNEFRRVASGNVATGIVEQEVVYYEIVGYLPGGEPIMPAHDFSESDDPAVRMLGRVHYSYGEDPTAIEPFGVWVYGIVRMVDQGDGGPTPMPYSWQQVERRAGELGLKTVPLLLGPLTGAEVLRDLDGFVDTIRGLADGPDPVGLRHPREGVVVRIEKRNGTVLNLKAKGAVFAEGEGIGYTLGRPDPEQEA